MKLAQRARETVQRLAGDVGAQRLERRVAALPTEQLVLWAESTLPASGRAFGDWPTRGRWADRQSCRPRRRRPGCCRSVDGRSVGSVLSGEGSPTRGCRCVAHHEIVEVPVEPSFSATANGYGRALAGAFSKATEVGRGVDPRRRARVRPLAVDLVRVLRVTRTMLSAWPARPMSLQSRTGGGPPAGRGTEPSVEPSTEDLSRGAARRLIHGGRPPW